MDTYAQERVDTLEAAVVTDSKILIQRSTSDLSTGIDIIRGVVSPLGEGDAIRWAQSLPGVATGADGTTAFYVRGGNMGGNLFSLDGVPVYGYTHLLGLTTVVPGTAIHTASLQKGGFDASESNFTSAHLRIDTKLPDEGFRFTASLNNFLAEAGAEGNWKGKLSYIVSARISPLALEYKALRAISPTAVGRLSDFGAQVGDVYGKLRWDISERHNIDAFVLGSKDIYNISMAEDSRQGVGWHNLLGQLRYRYTGEHGRLNAAVSYNSYGNTQSEERIYRGEFNFLSLQSTLDEFTARIDRERKMGQKKRLELSYGAKYRYAEFAPGQLNENVSPSRTHLADAYAQLSYTIPAKLEAKANFRYNRFYGTKDASSYSNPSGSAFIKWNFSKKFAVEASYDYLVQYYHSLEGLPVGWSIDMIVPSGAAVQPETTSQTALAFSFGSRRHRASAGGFYKEMENLVMYKYSQALFNGGMSVWEEDVELGKGMSYGGEFMYEYIGRELYARASYTLSKTNRSGFPSFYDGGEFHARFDRTHVLSVLGQWKGFSATLTLQSGHWEHGAAETYLMHMLGDVEWEAKYYFGVYNYHMPTVFRIDIGYHRTFVTGRVTHDLNVGVYNVTNHFNPFTLYFDAQSEKWMAIALLPIMPNFSYRVSF